MAKGKPVAELIQAIKSGRYDHQLDRVGEHIVAAIRERGEEIAWNVVETLEEGTKVKIVGTLKPKYFENKRGEVLRIEGTTVTVKLDKPIKRYRKTFAQVGIPANHIQILDLE